MKAVLLPLITLALALAPIESSAQTPPDNMRIFLLIGQSNMAGRGTVDPTEQPDPHIFSLGKDMKWQLARDPLHFDKKQAGVGPGLSFARALVKNDPGITIGLVPAAVGGSSLDQWAPGGKLYTDALARAHTAMQSGTIAGILWHQGESDSDPAKVATYGARFAAMITALRKDLGSGNIPVIMGELGRFRLRNASGAFNAALPSIASGVPNCGYVTSEGLTDRGDHLHFDTASQHTLGQRYAAEYLKLESGAH
jgi:hypothetical protein